MMTGKIFHEAPCIANRIGLPCKRPKDGNSDTLHFFRIQSSLNQVRLAISRIRKHCLFYNEFTKLEGKRFTDVE